MSNKQYCWLQDWRNLSQGLQAQQLSNKLFRCDAAFVIDAKNCSNGSLDILVIESNKFMSYETDEDEWKSPQSLSDVEYNNHINE